MYAKTINSEQVWQSADGQRTIWEVTLKPTDEKEQGKEYTVKTYSSQISRIGHEGEVRSYINPRGERFVRQVPTIEKKPRSQPDQLAIRAQWAIGQAINLASVKMDKDAITLPVIEKYAKELFATVSRVRGEDLSDEDKQIGDEHIEGTTRQ